MNSVESGFESTRSAVLYEKSLKMNEVLIESSNVNKLIRKKLYYLDKECKSIL